jgi:hypothetical protein
LLNILDPNNAPMPHLDMDNKNDPARNLHVAELAIDAARAMGIPTFVLPRDLCQGI